MHNSTVQVSMTGVRQRIVWKWANKSLGWNFMGRSALFKVQVSVPSFF